MLPIIAPSGIKEIGWNSGTQTSLTYANSTNGTWVEFGQTTVELCGFWISLGKLSSISPYSRFSIDVGISSTSGGTIYTVVDKFPFSVIYGTVNIYFPIRIPAGAYISVRGTRIGLTLTENHCIIGKIAQPWLHPGFEKMISLNITSYEPNIEIGGGNSNTWVEAISSLTEEIRGISVAATGGSDANRVPRSPIIEVGIGSASNEKTILWDPRYNNGSIMYSSLIYTELTIPVGTRISLKTNTGTDSTVATVIGLYG